MTTVWDNALSLSGTDLLLLLKIADHANDNGVCWPSVESLAAGIRLKPRQTRTLIARLEEQGYIHVERGVGRGNASSYAIRPTDQWRDSQHGENVQCDPGTQKGAEECTLLDELPVTENAQSQNGKPATYCTFSPEKVQSKKVQDETAQTDAEKGAISEQKVQSSARKGAMAPVQTPTTPIEPSLEPSLWVGGYLPPTHPDAHAGEPVLESTQSDATRSVALLTDPDVAVLAHKAEELAARYSFEFILRHVAAWWVEPKRGDVGVGALVYRIGKGNEPPPVGRDFRESDLYRRHHFPEVASAELYPTISPPIPPPPNVCDVPANDDPWPVMLIEVAPHLTDDAMRRWLHAARLENLGHVDGTPHYQIVLPPDADADNVQRRCLRTLRFSLSSFLRLKQPALLEFVLAETEPTP